MNAPSTALLDPKNTTTHISKHETSTILSFLNHTTRTTPHFPRRSHSNVQTSPPPSSTARKFILTLISIYPPAPPPPPPPPHLTLNQACTKGQREKQSTDLVTPRRHPNPHKCKRDHRPSAASVQNPLRVSGAGWADCSDLMIPFGFTPFGFPRRR